MTIAAILDGLKTFIQRELSVAFSLFYIPHQFSVPPATQGGVGPISIVLSNRVLPSTYGRAPPDLPKSNLGQEGEGGLFAVQYLSTSACALMQACWKGEIHQRSIFPTVFQNLSPTILQA